MLNKQRKDLDSGVRDLTYRRKPNRMTAHFLSEIMEPEGSGTVVSVLKEKNCQFKIPHWVKLFFRNKEEIELLSEEETHRETAASRSALKERLKEVVESERNWKG